MLDSRLLDEDVVEILYGYGHSDLGVPTALWYRIREIGHVDRSAFCLKKNNEYLPNDTIRD